MLLPLILLVFLVIIPLYIIYKPPSLVIRYLQRRWPDVLFHVPTTKKVVALTIDDGPSEYTEEILQILHANNATATFFIIGSHILAHRETVLQELIRRGNELANHAMFDEPSRSLSEATLVEQIQTVQKMIAGIYTAVEAPVPPNYFRPRSGFFTTRMRQIVAQLGYRLVLGSVYPHDPQMPFWRVNAAHILSVVRPGSIIVCHDGRSWTAPMLRRVIPELKRKGYSIVTVTELFREGIS
jgi:peptidoglycan/xylan/chitin deacetylase (PgdA/CDA1 family)